jgi:hypothetical protein
VPLSCSKKIILSLKESRSEKPEESPSTIEKIFGQQFPIVFLGKAQVLE